MPITLDAEGREEEAEAALALADDEVRSAERAVVHWEAELARKVEEAQALDGWWLAAWTQLKGTREEEVDRAVAAVEDLRRKLERSKAVLAQARERRRQAQIAREARMAGEAERLADLEAVASRVRAAGGLDADTLLELDLAIDHLRASLESVLAACGAASGVVAAANAVARRAVSARQHAQGDALGVPLAELREWGDRRALRQEQTALAERVQRLQAALQAVGASFDAGAAAQRPGAGWFDVGLEGGGLYGDWAQVSRLAATADQHESLASEARALADHLQVEHLALKRRLTEAEDAREALLTRLAGRG